MAFTRPLPKAELLSYHCPVVSKHTRYIISYVPRGKAVSAVPDKTKYRRVGAIDLRAHAHPRGYHIHPSPEKHENTRIHDDTPSIRPPKNDTNLRHKLIYNNTTYIRTSQTQSNRTAVQQQNVGAIRHWARKNVTTRTTVSIILTPNRLWWCMCHHRTMNVTEQRPLYRMRIWVWRPSTTTLLLLIRYEYTCPFRHMCHKN